MNRNEELIIAFYTCFQNKDYSGMQACYAGNATFSDPVFDNLNAEQVKAMWKMFCLTGKDLEVSFQNIKANEQVGSAEWTALYTFSATGRKVKNRIKASFEFENGKIKAHRDAFNFHQWAKQALGLPGLLLGWLPFLRKKIRGKAMQRMQPYLTIN